MLSWQQAVVIPWCSWHWECLHDALLFAVFHNVIWGVGGGSSVGSVRLTHCWCRFNSPVWKGFFLPELTFNADCLTCVHIPKCAIHALLTSVCTLKIPCPCQSLWIMETLKYPAYTIGWEAWLCCSWLFLGKATWIPYGRNHNNTVVKNSIQNKWINKWIVALVWLSPLQGH